MKTRATTAPTMISTMAHTGSAALESLFPAVRLVAVGLLLASFADAVQVPEDESVGLGSWRVDVSPEPKSSGISGSGRSFCAFLSSLFPVEGLPSGSSPSLHSPPELIG